MLDLQNILLKHKKWVDGFEDGIRADLSGADLRGADLRGADLREADLYGANLYGANLYGANLYGANLYGADLSGANLYGADLSGADLSKANLYRADLSGADLYRADLSGADLYGADLSGADLSGADLSGADLRGAKNTNSVLWSIYTSFYPLQCPETGSFVGYKKAGNIIIKLEICEDALRSSATSRKCRCSKAKVISFETLDGEPVDLLKVKSDYDSSFVYKIGETVEVDDFDGDRWHECAAGIHFFLTRDEAVKYVIQ